LVYGQGLPNWPRRKELASDITGKHAYITECCSCKFSNAPAHDFLDIQLYIERAGSIETALAETLQATELTGTNQYECPQCQSRQDARRFESLVEVPDILILTLERFGYDMKTCRRKKIQTKIRVPNTLNVKEIESFAHGRPSSEAVEVCHELLAVLYHSGTSAYGGHYSMDVWSDATGAWWTIDDHRVTRTKPSGDVPPGVTIPPRDHPGLSYTPSKTASMLLYRRAGPARGSDLSPGLLARVGETNRMFRQVHADYDSLKRRISEGAAVRQAMWELVWGESPAVYAVPNEADLLAASEGNLSGPHQFAFIPTRQLQDWVVGALVLPDSTAAPGSSSHSSELLPLSVDPTWDTVRNYSREASLRSTPRVWSGRRDFLMARCGSAERLWRPVVLDYSGMLNPDSGGGIRPMAMGAIKVIRSDAIALLADPEAVAPLLGARGHTFAPLAIHEHCWPPLSDPGWKTSCNFWDDVGVSRLRAVCSALVEAQRKDEYAISMLPKKSAKAKPSLNTEEGLWVAKSTIRAIRDVLQLRAQCRKRLHNSKPSGGPPSVCSLVSPATAWEATLKGKGTSLPTSLSLTDPILAQSKLLQSSSSDRTMLSEEAVAALQERACLLSAALVIATEKHQQRPQASSSAAAAASSVEQDTDSRANEEPEVVEAEDEGMIVIDCDDDDDDETNDGGEKRVAPSEVATVSVMASVLEAMDSLDGGEAEWPGGVSGSQVSRWVSEQCEGKMPDLPPWVPAFVRLDHGAAVCQLETEKEDLDKAASEELKKLRQTLSRDAGLKDLLARSNRVPLRGELTEGMYRIVSYDWLQELRTFVEWRSVPPPASDMRTLGLFKAPPSAQQPAGEDQSLSLGSGIWLSTPMALFLHALSPRPWVDSKTATTIVLERDVVSEHSVPFVDAEVREFWKFSRPDQEIVTEAEWRSLSATSWLSNAHGRPETAELHEALDVAFVSADCSTIDASDLAAPLLWVHRGSDGALDWTCVPGVNADEMRQQFDQERRAREEFQDASIRITKLPPDQTIEAFLAARGGEGTRRAKRSRRGGTAHAAVTASSTDKVGLLIMKALERMEISLGGTLFLGTTPLLSTQSLAEQGVTTSDELLYLEHDVQGGEFDPSEVVRAEPQPKRTKTDEYDVGFSGAAFATAV
jgi:hypothetical protein